MVKVENKETLRLLTKRFMKMNRARNIIAVIAIMLTSLLFTSLFVGSVSMILSKRATEIKQFMDSSHAIAQNLSEEDAERLQKTIEQDEDVERRSDSMMIATLDVKHNKLKLTSLMRDMYVEIPGYGGNKLNAAYSFGGITLLYKTIAQNFGIKMDGYVEVNFDAFVNVIDELGGIEVNLTESEAVNLRQTNYIKRRKYRSVKKGKQIFNGQQALGYCRIRHGKRQPDGHYPGGYTANGKGDDYGRTERQRLTIQAILKKVKELSAEELISLAEVILPNVKTDVEQDEIYSYLMTVVRMGTTKLYQFSLPIEGGYTSQTIRGQSCLVPDLASNKSALKKFLYKS